MNEVEEQAFNDLISSKMTSEVFWDAPDQERLILRFNLPVSWDEFDAGVRQAHAICAAHGEPVDLVVVAQTAMPEGIALTHLTAAFRSQPRNVRRLVIIPEKQSGISALLMELASIIRRLFPQQSPVIFVESLDQARSLKA